MIVNSEPLPVLRLIFNLIPINTGLRDFEGDVADLPAQGQASGVASAEVLCGLVGTSGTPPKDEVKKLDVASLSMLIVTSLLD